MGIESRETFPDQSWAAWHGLEDLDMPEDRGDASGRAGVGAAEDSNETSVTSVSPMTPDNPLFSDWSRLVEQEIDSN